ncbi:MAG: hypothetical protein GOV01_04015 [Candidatus Altiarchaeota archaeon]|nr:hypothetical protein [Candidatus Altiarchaeota archaeon]
MSATTFFSGYSLPSQKEVKAFEKHVNQEIRRFSRANSSKIGLVRRKLRKKFGRNYMNKVYLYATKTEDVEFSIREFYMGMVDVIRSVFSGDVNESDKTMYTLAILQRNARRGKD